MRVTIFGLGKVGSSVAFGLLREPVDLDLIETDDKIAWGEYNDLVQAAEVIRKKVDICLPIYPRKSEVYVITAGEAGKDSPDRNGLYVKNREAIESIMESIVQVSNENSLVLMVTNPSTKLAQDAMEYVPLVIPCGNMIDNARLRLCSVRGKHEEPDIDIKKKYLDVFESKGYTNWAITMEVLTRIRQWRQGLC